MNIVQSAQVWVYLTQFLQLRHNSIFVDPLLFVDNLKTILQLLFNLNFDREMLF